MSTPQLCPNDLLVAARRGALNAQDEARLAFHLARCQSCQAALEVGKAYDVALGARIGDDAIASRIAQRVTARPSRRWLAYAVGGGLLLFGTAAAAAAGSQVWEHYFHVQHVQHPEAAPVESEVASPSNLRARGLDAELEPAVSAVVALPSERVPSEIVPEPPIARSAPARTLTTEPDTAATLFAEANALRSKGLNDEARRRYSELQTRFAGSKEAKVSLISLGRLELASDPARALSRFDAYLAQSGQGTLAEEALFGRASALMRLGRTEPERATWRQLLQRFPNSVYAERARTRLAATP